MPFQDRKHPRLKHFDYSQNGYYFLTICTKKRQPLFGRISQAPVGEIPQVRLSDLGKLVRSHILQIDGRYPNVTVDCWVIMPDHIHMILILESPSQGDPSARASVQTVVRSLKTMVTKAVGTSVWQDSFYEHIIRDRESYEKITGYILGNPGKSRKG